MRLFVALELPDAARAALAGIAVDPDVWRRVRPETLHITLAFLGEQPASEPIARVVAAHAGEPAPRLSLERLLLLPPRRARVLAVELAEQGLGALQAAVSAELAALGVYTPEKRPFRAHVTIARLRPRTRPPRAVDAALEPLRFHGTAVTLYVSRLHPHGARYEALARAPLDVR